MLYYLRFKLVLLALLPLIFVSPIFATYGFDLTSSATATCLYTKTGSCSDAFDDNTGTVWYWDNYPSPGVPDVPNSIIFDFGSGVTKTITKMVLKSRNDTNQTWQDVIIYGSSDNSSWTSLANEANHSFSSGSPDIILEFSNSTAYRYYKIQINDWGSANWGANVSGSIVSEIELMETEGSPTPTPTSPPTATPTPLSQYAFPTVPPGQDYIGNYNFDFISSYYQNATDLKTALYNDNFGGNFYGDNPEIYLDVQGLYKESGITPSVNIFHEAPNTTFPVNLKMTSYLPSGYYIRVDLGGIDTNSQLDNECLFKNEDGLIKYREGGVYHSTGYRITNEYNDFNCVFYSDHIEGYVNGLKYFSFAYDAPVDGVSATVADDSYLDTPEKRSLTIYEWGTFLESVNFNGANSNVLYNNSLQEMNPTKCIISSNAFILDIGYYWCLFKSWFIQIFNKGLFDLSTAIKNGVYALFVPNFSQGSVLHSQINDLKDLVSTRAPLGYVFFWLEYDWDSVFTTVPSAEDSQITYNIPIIGTGDPPAVIPIQFDLAPPPGKVANFISWANGILGTLLVIPFIMGVIRLAMSTFGITRSMVGLSGDDTVEYNEWQNTHRN